MNKRLTTLLLIAYVAVVYGKKSTYYQLGSVAYRIGHQIIYYLVGRGLYKIIFNAIWFTIIILTSLSFDVVVYVFFHIRSRNSTSGMAVQYGAGWWLPGPHNSACIATNHVQTCFLWDVVLTSRFIIFAHAKVIFVATGFWYLSWPWIWKKSKR